MRIERKLIDDLKSRLPVSQVVGKRVKLRKRGAEFIGISPFKQEKTPSFCVNDAKNMWFDFASGKSGDIVDFAMLTQGLSFSEAVKALGAEAGIIIPSL